MFVLCINFQILTIFQAKLEKGESIEESEPNDVASLLKQWLRELPEPLIPAYLHDLFIRFALFISKVLIKYNFLFIN